MPKIKHLINQEEILQQSLEEPEIEHSEEDSDNSFELDVEETLAPAGYAVLRFSIPVAKVVVEIRKPTTKLMVAIERDMNKNHKDAGLLEQQLVGLSHLICRFGENTGDKAISYSKLENLDLADIKTMGQVMNSFFRF